jgi:large subunit ribosomal protein L24
VRADGRLVVAGINVVKKHQRGNPNAGQPGGIVDKEAPIDVSNVAIYNDETGKADRVGFRVEDGKKVRYFKSTKKSIDV